MSTRVLVVGSGAREHALAWECSRKADVEVLCAPGNGGTAAIATNVDVAADDVPNLVRLGVDRTVDLVVIGPDAAVAAGLADACAAAGLAVFGPTRAAGRIEASKEFAKQLMDAAGIPTGRWRAGGRQDREPLLGFAADLGGRCAVKADGLALGKGVVVCDTLDEAAAALDACLVEERFGTAGRRVVVEERLAGPEVSIFALSDGEQARLLLPACDYKRAHDGDQGANTGGMGVYAPPGWLGVDALCDEAAEAIIQPCLDALRERGTPYRGCLYAGLMLTEAGPRVLEFNARFGDPEAQVVLPMLDQDLLALLRECATGSLGPGRIRSLPGVAVGVVAAAEGYPGSVRSGDPIEGLGDVEPDMLVFHAGTRREGDGTLRTSGGRVLTVVGRGPTAEVARQRVYDNLGRIEFVGMWYRRDIALPSGTRAPVAAR